MFRLSLFIVACSLFLSFHIKGNGITPLNVVEYNGKSISPPDDIIPLKTLWKYTLPKNQGVSELVFHNGLIFWGNDDGRLIALDMKSGKIKWVFQADSSIFQKPAVDGDMIFFCSFDGLVHAVNISTGKEKWSYFAGKELRSTPVVTNNQVVITYKKTLISLEIETGLELWKNNCLTMNYLGYIISDSFVFYTDNINISAYNASNCTKLWDYNQNIFGMSMPVRGFGFIYYCNLEGVYAVQISNGKPKWKFSFNKENPPLGYKNPVVYDSLLYIPVDNSIYVLNAITGKLPWGYKNKSKKEINTIAVSPDKLYFTESENIIFALLKSNPKKPEKFSVETTISTQLHIEGSSGFFINPQGVLYAVKFP